MDVRVCVNGVEATVTVAGPDEAAALLASIGNLRAGSNQPALPSVQNVRVERPLVVNGQFNLEKEPVVDEGPLRAALHRTRTNPASAKLLAKLAASPPGMSDSKLRAAIGMTEDDHFGPVMSHISKCCKREGLPFDAVLLKQTRRGMKGKLHYFFRVTHQAGMLIRANEDFENQPDFTAFDDE
jgi:hypothetical protein